MIPYIIYDINATYGTQISHVRPYCHNP